MLQLDLQVCRVCRWRTDDPTWRRCCLRAGWADAGVWANKDVSSRFSREDLYFDIRFTVLLAQEDFTRTDYSLQQWKLFP
jgi:hypothetical protein